MIVKNNNLTNSTLIQIPILNLINSVFYNNKLLDKSILIRSTGSFNGLIGEFNF